MSTAAVETAPAPAPALPDYLTDYNAVMKDDAEWRYDQPPDYSKTRAEYEKTKQMNHEAASLPHLVETLVKNWEVEASFKPRLSDWRTIDHENYSFAINGGPPQTAEHMLEVGTYNAIIAPNEFYDPRSTDFAKSHKTFKRMMPTFAWEVLEVYSGPPTVAFKWRHWGEMKQDYVGFNDKGEKITAKAHGGPIDIQGVTVATVNDKVQLQSVQTWFDPLEMFRQIAPNGIVNKELVVPEQTDATNDEPTRPDQSDSTNHAATDATGGEKPAAPHVPPAAEPSEAPRADPVDDTAPPTARLPVSGTPLPAATPTPPPTEIPISLTVPAGSQGKEIKIALRITVSDSGVTVNGVESAAGTDLKVATPGPATSGESSSSFSAEPYSAVGAPVDAAETQAAHREMSRITPMECPFMNSE